jgi:hypothetical protein
MPTFWSAMTLFPANSVGPPGLSTPLSAEPVLP